MNFLCRSDDRWLPLPFFRIYLIEPRVEPLWTIVLDYGWFKNEECMVKPKNLARADVRKIEEGLNTNDLEMMIAFVDQIVGNAIR